MNAREASARAAKAVALLDTLTALVDGPLTGDAVRLLHDDAWADAELIAKVRPASAQTRELVAHLAQQRAVIREALPDDPFDGFPTPQPDRSTRA